VVRPPVDSRALSLDRQGLEEIKTFLGAKAEVVADIPLRQRQQFYDSMIKAVLETAKRRPFRELDVARVLDIPSEKAGRIIKGLMIKGALRRDKHRGEVSFIGDGSAP